MTINPNNTTAACSGSELAACPFCGGPPIRRGEFIECGDCSAQGPTDREPKTGWNLRAMVREAFRAGWYVNAIEAGDGEDQQPADYLAGCEEVDWLEYTKSLRTQASAPRSASVGDGVDTVSALVEFAKWAMREGSWEGGSLEGDELQDKAESLGLIVKAAYDPEKHGERAEFSPGDDFYEFSPALSAPPPIRIDRDAADLERVFTDACDEVGCSYDNEALLKAIADLKALAAISANTTVGSDARESALRDIISWKEDTLGPRPKVQGPYDCAPEITEAFDRGARMAFYRCALRASEAIASNPLEGKGIQSNTEQASSGLRSTKQREG